MNTDRTYEDIKLGERTYRIFHLPFEPADKLWTQLVGVLGPVLAEVAAHGTGASAGSAALKEFSRNVHHEDVVSIREALFDHIQMLNDQGDFVPLKPIYKNVFNRKLAQAYKLVLEAIKVNYSDFLDGLGVSL